jgi:hypothetical protein
MTTGAEILRTAYAASCDSLRRVLSGVTEQEFFWEPVALAEATDWLFASHQPVMDALTDLGDVDLDKLVPTNWGEEWPVHQVVVTLIN